MRFFVLLLLVAHVHAHATLVKVSSVYPDLSNKARQLKVGGTGLLFVSGARQFVVTASHVSQGSLGATIELGGAQLQIIGRAMSGTNDLELFEVSGADPAKIEASFDGRWIKYTVPAEQRRRWIDSHNFVPLLSETTDPHLDADNVFAKTRATILGMDYFSGLLHGDALIQPGTSGSPLVTVVPEPAEWKASTTPYDWREGFEGFKPGESVVRGLSIRRERFFSHASFVTAREIKELLDAYIKGQKPKAMVSWRAEGALLYRVDADRRLRETTTFAASTAGGTIVDSGNGVSIDGGDLASLAEDVPKEFLAKVSSFPSLDGERIMYWMLAIRHPTTSVMINYWAWFDMEFYPTLARFVFGTRQKEGPHMDLVSQLGPRFGKKGEYEITSPQYLKIDKNGVLLRLQLPGDTLEVQLNREGILCGIAACPEHFQPVIEAPARSGQVYLIDLHQLFFADISQNQMAQFRDPKLGKLSEKEYYQIVYDEIAREMNRPRISYRKQRANLAQPMKLQEGIETTIEWKP